MYKKAGLIVGGAIIVIAIIIFLIASGSSDKGKTKNVEQPAAVTTTAAAPSQNTNAPAQQQSGKQSVIQIDSDTLPTPSITEEIGIVQDKSMVLIDSSLYYSLTMLIGSDNKQLMYIVSEKGYNSVAVGDKCKVGLACYVTKNGSSYYAIQGIEKL